MYEQLLKLETYELTKRSTVHWERLMEIRHLKDRMVRKCQRLAPSPPGSKKLSQREPFVFQSVIAPSDFRLKEMEKWFREQHKRAQANAAAHRNSTHAGDAATTGQSSRLQLQAPRAPAGLIRSSTNASSAQGRGHHPSHSNDTSMTQDRTQYENRIERTFSLPSSSVVGSNAPAGLMSPAPIPILLVSQRQEYGLESPPDSPIRDTEEPERTPSPSDADPHATEEHGNNGKTLVRRRSSLKRSNSNDQAKTVSWADAQALDKQISRYAASAKHLQSSGT